MSEVPLYTPANSLSGQGGAALHTRPWKSKARRETAWGSSLEHAPWAQHHLLVATVSGRARPERKRIACRVRRAQRYTPASYRGTSLIRKRPPPWDPQKALGMVLP